jgi:ATP-dependent Clp protease ATP-binding subunit ClpA
VFERFTDSARQVVVFAQEEARALRHAYIGTEHLLLGLLRVEQGTAAQTLNGLGVTLDGVRAATVEAVGRGQDAMSGQIPFTPRTKHTLELALREALSLGHDYIATEHLLLGLVRMDEGAGVQVLRDCGCGAEQVRTAVIDAMARARPNDPPREPRPIYPTPTFGVAMLPALLEAARVFQLAVEEAIALEDDKLAAEHFLLALARVDSEPLNALLTELGITHERLHAELRRLRNDG